MSPPHLAYASRYGKNCVTCIFIFSRAVSMTPVKGIQSPYLYRPFKGTVSRDFLLLVFFMNQFPPSPRIFHLDLFEFFRKFAEIFASQGAPPLSMTLVANLPPVSATRVANFPPIFASIVDIGGKFASGVNDTGGKYATGVVDTGGK